MVIHPCLLLPTLHKADEGGASQVLPSPVVFFRIGMRIVQRHRRQNGRGAQATRPRKAALRKDAPQPSPSPLSTSVFMQRSGGLGPSHRIEANATTADSRVEFQSSGRPRGPGISLREPLGQPPPPGHPRMTSRHDRYLRLSRVVQHLHGMPCCVLLDLPSRVEHLRPGGIAHCGHRARPTPLPRHSPLRQRGGRPRSTLPSLRLPNGTWSHCEGDQGPGLVADASRTGAQEMPRSSVPGYRATLQLPCVA